MASGEEHKSHAKEYWLVFAALAILTVVELFIPEAKALSQSTKTTSLILLAVAKVFLVIYFFMHLKMETAWLKFIAAIPISAAIYAAVLIAEQYAR